MMGDRRKRERPRVVRGGTRHDGERFAGRVQLAVELDFPETVIGGFHESPNRLTVISSIVGGDSRNPAPNVLGFVQKLGVSQVKHGPVGDRGLIPKINPTGSTRLSLPYSH